MKHFIIGLLFLIGEETKSSFCLKAVSFKILPPRSQNLLSEITVIWLGTIGSGLGRALLLLQPAVDFMVFCSGEGVFRFESSDVEVILWVTFTLILQITSTSLIWHINFVSIYCQRFPIFGIICAPFKRLRGSNFSIIFIMTKLYAFFIFRKI